MIKPPKISIIIPIYNVEEYITECLQSVMRQTYKGEIECILVDDCGKDDSIAIAERLIADYKGKITFRILHHEHNRGLSAARNTGTDAATGDYIYYLDSDDYISDDCIEVLTQPLREREYDMVVGRMKMFEGMDEEYIWVEDTTIVEGNENVFKAYYVERKMYATAWNRLINRNLFSIYNLSFKEGLLHEDELWNYMLFTQIQTLVIVNYRTYYYRIRPNSIVTDSTANIEKHIADTYYAAYYALCHPWNSNKDAYTQCILYYINVFLNLAMKNKNESYYPYYKQLRKSFDYHPISLLLYGKISLTDFKHKLHYALPSLLGYWYLQIRQWKNKK